MKTASLLITSLLILLNLSRAQCPNDNTNPFSTTINLAGPGDSQTLNCLWGGDYVWVTVSQGEIYRFSTCSSQGFNTELTLYDNSSGVFLAHNDDQCGLQSEITWTAGFSGTIRMLIDQSPGCTSNAICQEGTITWVASLPVEIRDFRARSGENTIQIEWSMAAKAFEGITVERSADARDFHALETVLPASDKAGEYQIIDRQPLAGTNYYRLRIEGRDGSVTYSAVVSAQTTIYSSLAFGKAWPNPVQDRLSLEASAPAAGPATLEVFDLNGRRVFMQAISLQSGNQEDSVDLSALPKGIYQLRLTQHARKAFKRIVKH